MNDDEKEVHKIVIGRILDSDMDSYAKLICVTCVTKCISEL
jgi:hypothetical protein